MNYMKQKFALLADGQGNASAIKAVVQDSIKEVANDWFLGDLIMPGFREIDLFEIFNSKGGQVTF